MTVLDAVAERVARGETLRAEDARAVLGSFDLIAIGMMGDEVRRRMHGVRTTFVRVFEVHADAPPSSVPAGVMAGEFRLIGRPANVAAATSAVSTVRAIAGAAPVSGYNLRDLASLASDGAAVRAVFAELRSAGLDAVAEVSIDDVVDPTPVVRAARDAGLEVLRLTVCGPASTTGALDAGNAADAQIALLERARVLQESVGGFRAFAPLPRSMSVTTPTTGYDDVKQIALARLIATNIESIQVDWPLYGPKLAQVALTVGADDVDGIAALDTQTLGRRRTALEEIRRNIQAAALEPAERDGLFRLNASPSSPPRRSA